MEILSDTIFTHYVNNTSLTEIERGACLSGSKNLLFTSAGRSQAARGGNLVAGVNGGRLMFNSIDAGYTSLGNATTAGIGDVFGLIARAQAFIGAGQLYINGISRAVSASTALQILLYVSGSYSGAGTGPYVAGLSQPTAPTLANTPTASTIMAGTYSAVIWFVRGATGGRSRRSSPSAVIVNSGFKMRLTVAGADLTTASTNGYDRIGIGVTAAGFGATGPHYEEREIAISSLTTVDTVANSVELEWADGSLVGKDLAPILDFPPPAGVFGCAMEDVVAVIGCYGDTASGVSATSPGTAIAVSLPVFIESFPPDQLLFLPGPPKGVLSRAADGFVFIGGDSYVAALLYTGGKNPLSLRVLWPSTGIASPNGWFLGEGGRLYAATGTRGLVRISEKGEPETEWAKDIADDTAFWIMANVVGGYDASLNRAVFGHVQKLYCFNPSAYAATGHGWDTPIDLSTTITGNIVSMVPVSGGLLIATSDGTTIRLYNFNLGTALTWEVYSENHLSPTSQSQLFRADVSGRFTNASTVLLRLFINGADPILNSPGVSISMTPVSSVAGLREFLPTQKINVRNVKSHQIHLQHTSVVGDNGPDRVVIRGVNTNHTF